MWLPLLVACGASCPADLAPGTATAEVDGASWDAAAVTWNLAGTSVQIVTDGDPRVTLVLQADADGQDIDLDALPLTIPLGPGGFATVYPSGGASMTTDDDGEVTLTTFDGTVLRGCFDLVASGDDGDTTFTAGAFAADPFGSAP